MSQRKPIVIIAMIVIPLFCIGLLVVGVVGGGLLYAASSEGSLMAGVPDRETVEAEVVSIAAEFAATDDIEAARQRLHALNLPNAEQYVSFTVDRYLQENRGPDDVETMNLFMLADALGAATPSMIAALTTPTPAPTPTLPPTATLLPTNTPTLEPTETLVPEPTATAVVEAAEVPPTDEPTPIDTPEPVVEPPTPGPPTDTPEPTVTPEPPKPAVDFVVAEAYLIPNPAYNSCPGNHQIFVTVVDAAGTPIDGVTVEDTFRAVPPKTTGEKGSGKLEYDLWNNGFSLEITKKGDGGPATSEVTPKMSSWDEDIPNEWLVAANYCLDMNDCIQRKNNNQLCRGHYSYNVTFKRTY